MTGEADVGGTLYAEARRINDVGFQKALGVFFAGAVTAFARDVQIRPALRIMVRAGAVTTCAELKI